MAFGRCLAIALSVLTSLGANGQEYRANYLPAESDTGMFGANSNWAGANMDAGECAPDARLVVRLPLLSGTIFTIQCPTGSKVQMNLFEVAREIAGHLAKIFLRDRSGRRPVY